MAPSNTSAEPGENGGPSMGQQEWEPPCHPHAVLPAGPLGTAMLRLAGGSHPCEGTVQVKHHGWWMPVCRRSWSAAASRELCHRLHCGDAEGDVAISSLHGDRDISKGCPATVSNCSEGEAQLCLLQLDTETGCCAAELVNVTCTGKSMMGARCPHGMALCAIASPSHTQEPQHCVWLEGAAAVRAVWSCGRRANGALCATTAGTWPTPPWCAGSWAAGGRCVRHERPHSAGGTAPCCRMR